MKRYFKKTWPCYLILFLLFFVGYLTVALVLPNIPREIYDALLPYETPACYTAIGISVIVVSFYAVWHGGNGDYDFLPLAATYLFQFLVGVIFMFLGKFYDGSAPFFLPFLIYLVPLLPQMFGIAIVRTVALYLPHKQ